MRRRAAAARTSHGVFCVFVSATAQGLACWRDWAFSSTSSGCQCGFSARTASIVGLAKDRSCPAWRSARSRHRHADGRVDEDETAAQPGSAVGASRRSRGAEGVADDEVPRRVVVGMHGRDVGRVGRVGVVEGAGSVAVAAEVDRDGEPAVVRQGGVAEAPHQGAVGGEPVEEERAARGCGIPPRARRGSVTGWSCPQRRSAGRNPVRGRRVRPRPGPVG